MNERFDDLMQYSLKPKILEQILIKVDKTVLIISLRFGLFRCAI